MKFKITLSKEPSHKAAATCVGWSNAEEVFSAGDDNQLLSWKVSSNESTKIVQLKPEVMPTDMQFIPRTSSNLGKQSDLILLASADGRFFIINRTGRIERAIEGHKGAILVGQWSHDGTGLMTGGEDGFIKIWSRSGMLRSTLVASESSIYGACWSPDNQFVVYTQGQHLVIKPLAPSSTPHKWKAHEGLVLCVAWSAANDTILSGGEDCRYRLWDNQGRVLFTSTTHDSSIISLAWSPNGDMFAVGSYNTLRLCDSSGWSKTLDKPSSGCIYKISWSTDGTQLAGACANGRVLFAHIIQRSVQYQNFTATVAERKTIVVNDVLNDATDYIELPERAIHVNLRYNHLVVTSPSQCHIFSTDNWNTPTILDLKDGSVILIQLCDKHFLLIEKSTAGIYNYHGKLTASPRWPNMRLESLKDALVSISPETLAVCDTSDPKVIHLIDISSSRSSSDNVTSIQHTLPITKVALDQSGSSRQRILALLDKARDLHILKAESAQKLSHKLGGQIHSFTWNAEDSMIAAIQDIKLLVYYCPSACFDSTLLKQCIFQYDAPEIGRSPKINDFVGNSVSVRRADGSLINVPISPFPSLLHKFVQDNKWQEALNLCRTVNDRTLWACLAALASQSNSDLLDTAEEAYAAINYYDKVFYIQHIKDYPTKAQQMAGAAMLGGAVHTAETILLQNGMVYYAISNHILMHNWNRAVELAMKHKTHVDTVLFMRRKYLERMGKMEQNKTFLELNSTIPLDDEKIEAKIAMENAKYKKQ